ncbi:MAG: redoxin domain-containing protein [Acidobacteria bacterium]|nr:redoxin domain-containing protein [Acidobacteriota bacterium]
MSVLKEGEKAPDFRLPADDGTEISFGDFRGSYVLLYFFPKALTPG